MTINYGNHECLVVNKAFMDKQYDRIEKGLCIGELGIIRSDDDDDVWFNIYNCYLDADDEGEYYAVKCDEYGNEE